MDIQPILKTLRHQKTAALLIAFEIALSCAIICNALFLIAHRLDRSNMPSGVAEAELVRIQVGSIGEQDDDNARIDEDVAGLRGIPGVVSVAAVQQVPFGGSSWNSGLRIAPEQKNSVVNATSYFDGGGVVRTFGLELLAGRDFTADEYVDFDTLFSANGDQSRLSSAIITRSLGEKLWPGENPLGKAIYLGKEPIRVVGVVAALVRPSIFDDSLAGYSAIYPVRGAQYTQYVLRVGDGSSDAIIEQAAVTLRELQPNRIVLNTDTFTELREEYFQQDRVMAGLLVAVIAALLTVTALGIVGLASFWVQRRQRQIGIRRALGATRGNVLRYFQTENFLIVTAGIAAGMFAAYAINRWLMQHYELPPLPLHYLPIGAFALWALGQLAVLAPALRAMQVPPAVATRSV